MESPWRRTFSSVFILFVNNVYVYSQSVPPGAGQLGPLFAEYVGPGPLPPPLMNIPPFLPNGIYPDVLASRRAFPDEVGQPSGPVEVPVPGPFPQRSSMPSIQQLLYSLPSPNLIGPIPIPILPPPPVPPIVPVPHNIQNAPAVPCQPNSAPYFGPNSQIISGAPNAPCPQNPGIPPAMQFIPPIYTLSPQGPPMSAQFIPNSGPILPYPQEPQPASLYIHGLPNSNIISFNPQPPMIPPVNQYVPNVSPCPQPPPIVPPAPQCVPGFLNPNSGIPIAQLQAFPQNFNDMGSNLFNLVPPFCQFIPNENIIMSTPPQILSQGPGIPFLPNPRISGPFAPIQILPPAVPPFLDPNFAPQQFYPDPNNIPPFLPPPFYPITSQFSPDLSNLGLALPPPTMLIPDMSLPNLQPMFPPPNTMPCYQLPPPIFFPSVETPNFATFAQPTNPSVFPNQQIFLPANDFDYPPFIPVLGTPPQFQINNLPTVLPLESLQLPVNDKDHNLPINLQINLPATNIPPPCITIISTVPPNPPAPSLIEISDSDSSSNPFGNFIPFPMYSPPPVIVQGSKSKRKKWIPILIALFANRGCCGDCGGSCCCSCNNIPIPFPIVIPTNNPIINNKNSDMKV